MSIKEAENFKVTSTWTKTANQSSKRMIKASSLIKMEFHSRMILNLIPTATQSSITLHKMLLLIEEVLRLQPVVTDLTKMEISLTIKDVRSLTSPNLLKMVTFQSFSTIMVEDLILQMLLAQSIKIEMEISLQ